MCGIVGAIAERNVVPILINGLQRLEYRGYDSAGLAVLTKQGITRVRRSGKVQELEQAVQQQALHSVTGIALAETRRTCLGIILTEHALNGR